MTDAKATLEIELEDQASGPAEDAADALERLKTKLVEDQKALRDMTAAMGRLKGSSADVVEQKQKLADKIKATREGVGAAQAQYLKLGGALGDLGKQAPKVAAQTTQVAAAVTTSGEASAEASIQTKLLGDAMKAAPAAALAFVAAVYAAIAVFAVFAVKAADAARSARLYLEALGGSAEGGRYLGQELEGLSQRIPMARDELRAMAGDLANGGLQGKNLVRALSAAGTAAAVLGGSAGAKIKGIAEQAQRTKRLMIGIFDLQGTGVTLQDVAEQLAKDTKVSAQQARAALQQGAVRMEVGLAALDKAVQNKLGGVARRQMLGLNTQFTRMRENIGQMFAGLNIDPLLEALADVLSLLDNSTVTGHALRVVFASVLNPLISAIASNGPLVKAFFKGLVIGALVFILILLKVKNAIKRAFGGDSKASVDGVKVALAIGAAVAGALGAALLVVVGALLLLVAPFLKFAAAAKQAWDLVSNLGWAQLGKDIVDGIIKGIKDMAGKLSNTMGDTVGEGIKAARKKLDINSPSRVMRKIAHSSGEGLILGHKDKAAEVRSSMVDLVDPSPVEGKLTASTGRETHRGGASGVSVVFNLHGVQDARGFSALRPEIVDMLERALGGGSMSPVGAR